jgi:MYXO-CTERM domain-containing protein
MRRQVLLALAVVCVPTVAQAGHILSAGNWITVPGPFKINIILTADPLDIPYHSSDMRVWINGGVGTAPRITAVFGKTGGAIPTANLAGSIWQGGAGGIYATPDGTYPTDSGLGTHVAFATAGFTPQLTSGIYATLALDATGVPAGNYSISLINNPVGPTQLYGSTIPLEIIDGTITVTPEPASVVMGLFALAGLAAVAVRRHRARRVMAARSRTSGAV